MRELSKFSQFWNYRVRPFLHRFGWHCWVISVELPEHFGDGVKYAETAQCIYCSKEVKL